MVQKMARRRRLLSIQSTSLEEVITVYEKLKRGREETQALGFRHSFGLTTEIIPETDEFEELVPHHPSFHSIRAMENTARRMDFNKYKNIPVTKYQYLSEATDLLQANELEGLSPAYTDLLQGKNYWLNIVNPDEKDYLLLSDSYAVHDLSIADVREGNSEEKVEVFRHYTFISLRLMGDSNVDMDFNIIIFSDFIITTHRKEWKNINDILGFLYLLYTDARTELKPEWVLFSVFTELAQDAKFFVRVIEPVINNIRIGSKSLSEMSSVMRRNFDMEVEIYRTSRFLKPVINILRQLKSKCSKRLSEVVLTLLSDICDDLRQLSEDVSHFNHILERSQDTCLALANVELSRQANIMSVVMNRVSEVALVFLPVQAIAGFFGMNVRVPFQGIESTWYFWGIVMFSVGIAIFVYIQSRNLSEKSTPDPLPLPVIRHAGKNTTPKENGTCSECFRSLRMCWIFKLCQPHRCRSRSQNNGIHKAVAEYQNGIAASAP